MLTTYCTAFIIITSENERERETIREPSNGGNQIEKKATASHILYSMYTKVNSIQ